MFAILSALLGLVGIIFVAWFNWKLAVGIFFLKWAYNVKNHYQLSKLKEEYENKTI